MEETSSNSHPGFLSSFAAGGFLFSYGGKSTIWGISIGNFFFCFAFRSIFCANLTDGWSLSTYPHQKSSAKLGLHGFHLNPLYCCLNLHMFCSQNRLSTKNGWV